MFNHKPFAPTLLSHAGCANTLVSLVSNKLIATTANAIQIIGTSTDYDLKQLLTVSFAIIEKLFTLQRPSSPTPGIAHRRPTSQAAVSANGTTSPSRQLIDWNNLHTTNEFLKSALRLSDGLNELDADDSAVMMGAIKVVVFNHNMSDHDDYENEQSNGDNFENDLSKYSK